MFMNTTGIPECCGCWCTPAHRINISQGSAGASKTRKLCYRKDDRTAPYIWVPWKFKGLPDYAHGYFSQNFSWAFVPMDPVNVLTKFEVSSVARFWDNRGYPLKFGHRTCSYLHTLFYAVNFRFCITLVFQLKLLRRQRRRDDDDDYYYY